MLASTRAGQGGLGGIQRGFTLMELLIALTLLSLILSVLYGGLRLGAKTWDAVDDRVTQTEEQRLVRGFLRRALLQTKSVEWEFPPHRYVMFFGDSRQLDFVSPLSGYVGLGGLYVMRLALVPHEDGKALIMQRWLLHPDVLEGQGDVPEWRPLESPGHLRIPYDHPSGVYGVSLLMESVDEMEFRYFGRKQRAKEWQWHTEWKEVPGLPDSIGLRIGPKDDWPELIVSLTHG